MRLTSVEAIINALATAQVRYLVAGGLAVNAHGYLRFTKDIDLVIELHDENLGRALEALAGLGYRPAIPVAMADFLDSATRRRWAEEKRMQVFQLWSDQHPETSIDIFVTAPFDFDEEYDHALVKELEPGRPVRFVSMPTLIRMKEQAGRQQDLVDIENLRLRMRDGG